MSSTIRRILRTVEHGFAFIGLCTTAVTGLAVYNLYTYNKEKTAARNVDGLLRSSFQSRLRSLPPKFILHLDLDDVRVTDTPIPSAWEAVLQSGMKTLSLRSAIRSIEKASGDQRVKGFVVTGCDGVPGLASVQELRTAVTKFNKANEKNTSVFYTDSFGEAENKMMAYYLAAAFNKIYLQPTGVVMTTGFCLSVPFFKELMEKWNIQFRVWAKEEYKTLFNSFTERSFSEPHRQELEHLLEMIYEQVTDGIAIGRGMQKEDVQRVIDSAPLTAQEALEAGFIDKITYRDDIWNLIATTKNSTELPKVSLSEYHRLIRKEEKTDKKKAEIVIVSMSGQIHSGRNSNAGSLASDKINEDIALLMKNTSVKAVIIRVNSPGGSVVASDAIRNQITRLRENGKTVVVSMGDVAASGGYYISLGADKIVANPGTMTGSIGVVVGGAFLRDALSDQGVNVELVKRGANSDLLSPFAHLTEKQKGMVEQLVDGMYREFVTLVGDRRSLTDSAVAESAGGRVWLGKEACDRGLVDYVGGLDKAIAVARSTADLPETARIEDYNPRSGVSEFLARIFNQLQPDLSIPFSNLKPSVEMYSPTADTVSRSLC